MVVELITEIMSQVKEDTQYFKELENFMRIKVKTNSKISHSRKRNKLFKEVVFGGYEYISVTEFYINTKISMN